MLRERERETIVQQKTRRKTAPPPATSPGIPNLFRLPTSRDSRLDVLSHHVVDNSQLLQQDHLSNVSDFRIQSQSAFNTVLPSEKEKEKNIVKQTTQKPDSKREINRRQVEEANAAIQRQNAAMSRELYIKRQNTDLKSYILACAHVGLVSDACRVWLFDWLIDWLIAFIILRKKFNVENLFLCRSRFGLTSDGCNSKGIELPSQQTPRGSENYHRRMRLQFAAEHPCKKRKEYIRIAK